MTCTEVLKLARNLNTTKRTQWYVCMVRTTYVYQPHCIIMTTNEMQKHDSSLNTSKHDCVSTICVSSCARLSSDIELWLQTFGFGTEAAEGSLLLSLGRRTSCGSAKKNTSSAGRLMRHVEYLNTGSHRVFSWQRQQTPRRSYQQR